MEWISVNDKLPLDQQDCLITDGKLVEFSVYLIWVNRVGFSAGRHFGKISHWMPFPEPPKE